MLDLIGLALEAENIRFTRFDGKSRVEQRKHAVDSFRADPTLNVLLVTVGSGSVGYAPS